MDFAPSFFLLQQETFLVESSLAGGLTALRGATLSDRGRFYSAFFQLSIGLERLFKLILVIDYMVSNALERPTYSWLRGFSHDLVRLHTTVSEIPAASGILTPLVDGSTEKRILSFLSAFARQSRYYNLDALTQSTAGSDPLREWGRILEVILKDDVPPRRRRLVDRESRLLAEMTRDFTLVIAHDLEQKPLELEDAYRIPALQSVAAPYAVARIFEFLRPARGLLYELGTRAHSVARADADAQMHVPDMADMLVFAAADRAYVLKKKRWP